MGGGVCSYSWLVVGEGGFLVFMGVGVGRVFVLEGYEAGFRSGYT